VAQPRGISKSNTTPAYGSLPANDLSLGALNTVDVNSQSPWLSSQSAMYWQLPSTTQHLVEPASPFDNTCDFTHLIELDNIMTIDPDVIVNTGPIPELPPIHEAIRLDPPTQANAFAHPQVILNEPRNHAAVAYHHRSMLPDPTEFDYLQTQLCFELPSRDLLLSIVERYFLVVHPNLPIVSEAEFWAVWRGKCHTSNISLLLIRAILFTTISVRSFDSIPELCTI
jgi:hypothetical protein